MLAEIKHRVQTLRPLVSELGGHLYLCSHDGRVGPSGATTLPSVVLESSSQGGNGRP